MILHKTLIAIASVMVCAAVLVAPNAAQTTQPAQTQPADTQPSAEEVLHQLMDRRSENPLIEPARPPMDDGERIAHQTPSMIAGRASAGQTPLRSEGQFIVGMRGRMVSAADSPMPWMFVFDSDSNTLQDPPMFLMPCQLLEDMEHIVDREGDAAAFTISGQIFVYHGANYLLPTMLKRVPIKGNLQP